MVSMVSFDCFILFFKMDIWLLFDCLSSSSSASVSEASQRWPGDISLSQLGHISCLSPLLGVRRREVDKELCRSFSGVSVEVLCALLMCIFKPFSDFEILSHWSHLKTDFDISVTFSVTSVVIDCFLSSFLLSSLLIWLGDFFTFMQELWTSSFLKVKLSLPMVRLKLKMWLDCVSAWQNARHLSTTIASIFLDKGHIDRVHLLLSHLGWIVLGSENQLKSHIVLRRAPSFLISSPDDI